MIPGEPGWLWTDDAAATPTPTSTGQRSKKIYPFFSFLLALFG